MESRDRNTYRYIIWTLDRYRMDWVFMDCDIGGRGGAYFEHDGHHRGDRLEYKPNSKHLLANFKYECCDVCEYPDFVIDNGNAEQRGYGGRDRRDVACGCGSRTGTSNGWWNRDDVGGCALHEQRGGYIMVADIFT